MPLRMNAPARPGWQFFGERHPHRALDITSDGAHSLTQDATAGQAMNTNADMTAELSMTSNFARMSPKGRW